jgi:hypothetical protein
VNWAQELERRIQGDDARTRFLWIAFAAMFGAAWVFVTNGPGVSREAVTWLLTLAAATYLFGGSKVLGAFYNSVRPRWNRQAPGFQAIALTRFVEKYGAPRAARLLSLFRITVYGVLAFGLWSAAPNLPFWAMIPVRLVAITFLLSCIVSFVPFLLGRKFVWMNMAKGLAGLLDHERKDTGHSPAAEQLRASSGNQPWAALKRSTGTLVWALRQAKKVEFGYRLSVLLAVALAMPTMEGEPYRIAELGAGLFLAFGAFELLGLLYVDSARTYTEELHASLLLGRTSRANVVRTLLIIDAFQRNHYILNRPVSELIADLGLSDTPID